MRFHSSLVAPLVQQLADQCPWLEERLGCRFDADIYKDDGADYCIRQEADLFDYDRDSLDWLATATGQLPSPDPQQVAAQMHHLRCKPSGIIPPQPTSSVPVFRQLGSSAYRHARGARIGNPSQ